MDRLLARLERRIGMLAVPHLTWLLVGGQAAVFVLMMMKREQAGSFAAQLNLNIDAVTHGQVWRLFTYIFIPGSTSMLWILLNLWWLWMLGSNLESQWGAFKFNAYYLLGMLATTVAALILSYVSPGAGTLDNTWLNYTLLFAFATLFPDYQILLLVIPVKVKWLGLATAAYLGYVALRGDWAMRAAMVAAMGNYFLFFTPQLIAMWRGRSTVVRQAARRAATRQDPAPVTTSSLGQRVCAICGALETDGADIRVCSCEKCGGVQRTLCLPHARNH